MKPLKNIVLVLFLFLLLKNTVRAKDSNPIEPCGVQLHQDKGSIEISACYKKENGQITEVMAYSTKDKGKTWEETPLSSDSQSSSFKGTVAVSEPNQPLNITLVAKDSHGNLFVELPSDEEQENFETFVVGDFPVQNLIARVHLPKKDSASISGSLDMTETGLSFDRDNYYFLVKVSGEITTGTMRTTYYGVSINTFLKNAKEPDEVYTVFHFPYYSQFCRIDGPCGPSSSLCILYEGGIENGILEGSNTPYRQADPVAVKIQKDTLIFQVDKASFSGNPEIYEVSFFTRYYYCFKRTCYEKTAVTSPAIWMRIRSEKILNEIPE